MVNTNSNNNINELDYRSRAVECLLEPLLGQINSLTLCGDGGSGSGSSSEASNGNISTMARKAGQSKRAHALVQSMIDSIENFLRLGSEISHESMSPASAASSASPHQQLDEVLESVRSSGGQMIERSREFANDPLNGQRRLVMVQASRDLLNAVSRLLAIADVIDVDRLLASMRAVQLELNALQRAGGASSADELARHFAAYSRHASELNALAAARQFDFNDAKLRDELACARATLQRNAAKMFAACKCVQRYPEASAAHANHEHVLREMSDALEQIHGIATSRITSESIKHLYDEAASLSVALDEFDRQILSLSAAQFNESRMRPKLEHQLESIISAVALMADAESTRATRRDKIVNECNALRQALQDLLNAYVSSVANNNNNGSLDAIPPITSAMLRMTRTVRRRLRKAIVDHISDSFIEVGMPMEAMIEAAHGTNSNSISGQEQQLAECVQIFMDHADKLIEVSSMACSMWHQPDGIKLVRLATIQLQAITPQAVNAARILSHAHSLAAVASNNNRDTTTSVASENMSVFRAAWRACVALLCDAVDDITLVGDFLSVSETHILDDLNRCVMALRDNDADALERTAAAVRGRIERVCHVCVCETDLYEPDECVAKVLDVVGVVRDSLCDHFMRQVEHNVRLLSSGDERSQTAIDDNAFIDVARLVYDAVHDIRHAVLVLNADAGADLTSAYTNSGGGDDAVDSDLDELEAAVAASQAHQAAAAASASSAASAAASNAYWQNEAECEPESEACEPVLVTYPAEEREQIQRQLESFRQEKRNFDREVLKWDDKGNDIIVLAKQMCVIMMEMTDFTRGRGPLKTTMHIISAAKKISECGAKLDKLARDIAEECPESQSKRELDAYLKPIPLFCNQLNIASKVKANVIDVSGEPIITGLDSATSLIISAKNLMTAVVSVVKASYVASTKYTSKTGSRMPIVQWKMKAPEKKPLVIQAKPQDVSARVRKASQKKRIEPIRELSDFHA